MMSWGVREDGVLGRGMGKRWGFGSGGKGKLERRVEAKWKEGWVKFFAGLEVTGGWESRLEGWVMFRGGVKLRSEGWRAAERAGSGGGGRGVVKREGWGWGRGWGWTELGSKRRVGEWRWGAGSGD